MKKPPTMEELEALYPKETMPVYDESIFYPEKAVMELGFTEEDQDEIAKFFRWHMDQREMRNMRKELYLVLLVRGQQLVEKKKLEILEEQESFNQLFETSKKN